ncbi:TPA: hypothetical protein DEP06_01670, partial [Candidatus Daviesbacteria bacterium]|nr:hypothetical protein [Candidatus Daviesbacteria bacterium]
MIKIGLVIAILGIIGTFVFFNLNSDKPKIEDRNDKKVSQNTDEPPLKLKSIGVEFSDFKFTKEKLQFNRLFMGYGFVIPGS